MCGVAAAFGDVQHERVRLRQSLDTLAHRGPDDSGDYEDAGVWLGSRRLSIHDLTSAGRMPMTVEEAVTVVFNGEIYNYLELREHLRALGHRFRSRTDTEVLARSYLEWGTDCLRRFNGMWAFVLWDHRDRSAVIARDRFGVKPLYYSLERDRCVLASEPKFILAADDTDRRANDRALFQLLVEKRVDTRQSFYGGIEVFPPGCFARFRPGDPAIAPVPFWVFPDEVVEGQGHVVDDASTFASVLEDSVRIRLRSDVPVGFTLSGGLDSTAIVSTAQRLNPSVPHVAFTSTYTGSATVDERAWARKAASALPDVRLEEVDTPVEDWLGTLRRVVHHMDGPGVSPAVFPLWRIMQRARALEIPVLLEGQGADEILGGYAVHRVHALLDRISDVRRAPRGRNAVAAFDLLASAWRSNGPRRTLIDALTVGSPVLDRARERYVGVRGALNPEFVDQFSEVPARDEAPASPSGSRLFAKLRSDFLTNTLPAFLHYGDAISMAHGIESRLPFLDYRMVELCLRLPYELRGGGRHTKEALRRYLRTVGQPAIAARTDKQGFPTPVAQWMAAGNGELPRMLLMDPAAQIAPYVDRQSIERLIARHVAGTFAASAQLYALITTEVWLQECL